MIMQRYNVCKTHQDVKKLTLRYISKYGADYYLVGVMPPENEIISGVSIRGHILGGHWIEPWIDHYTSQDYFRADPRMKHILTKDTPLIWNEIKYDEHDAKKIMMEAGNYGLKDGITLSQQNIYGQRIGTSFSGKKMDLENPSMPKDLTFIAACAIDGHMRAKHYDKKSSGLELTLREREVTSLASRGCTSAAIGEKLGITVATVEKHYRSVSTKLTAKNRSHTIATAIRLKLIN